MMLIERVRQLHTAAVAADDENALKSRTGDLVSLATSVETVAETVRRSNSGLAELRTTGVSVDTELVQAAAQVAATLRVLSKSLQGLPVKEPLVTQRTQVKAALSFAAKFREFVEKAWAVERSREMPTINEDLVAALADSGIEVEEIRSKIETAQGMLVVLNNRALPEPGDIAKLFGALETLRSCGQRISEMVDPSLAQVIMDAQKTVGVSLSLFTPEVLTGLNRLGILNRFRVRLQ